MKRPHNYYKIHESSETGKNLQSFVDKCNEVSETARQWVEKQGGSSYFESPDGMSGGVSAVEFENTIAKEGWERVEGLNGVSAFFPVEGSELEKEMYALPIVSEAELIKILHFLPRMNSKGKAMPFTFGNTTPVLFVYNGYWYVDVPYECKHEDIEPIAEKEFLRRRMAATNLQKE